MLTRVSISITHFRNQSVSFCLVYQKMVGKTALRTMRSGAQKQKNPPSKEGGLGRSSSMQPLPRDTGKEASRSRP
jgi:hypothetical protein